MTDVLYKPGISFTNPPLVKIAAPVRNHPWFYERKGVGPLSAANKLKRWDGAQPLTRYKAVWNRAAKMRNTAKLGAYFHYTPDMNELGQAPPATSETSATSRGPLGFLENLISVAGQAGGVVADVLTQRSMQQQQAAIAQSQSYMTRMGNIFTGTGEGNVRWLWIAGLGAVGLGVYIFLRRK